MSRNQKEKNMQGKQQIKSHTKLGETMFECHSHVIYKVLYSFEQIKVSKTFNCYNWSSPIQYPV